MESAPPARPLRALGMLLLATITAAVGFPLVKVAALLHQRLLPGSGDGFVTAVVAGARFLLPVPVLVGWQFRQGPSGRMTPNEMKQGLSLGLFAATGMIALSDSLRLIPASTSAFFVTLYAVMIPVWLALRHRRMPGPLVWLSGIMVLAGVAILGHIDWRDIKIGRGEAEALLGAVLFMGQVLCLDNKAFAGNRSSQVTLSMFLTMGAVFGGLILATMPNAEALWILGKSPAWLSLTFLLAFPATLAPILVANAWQPKIAATQAGIIYSIEPVFGSIFAVLLPSWLSRWTGVAYANESATHSLLIGGGLITLANILIQW